MRIYRLRGCWHTDEPARRKCCPRLEVLVSQGQRNIARFREQGVAVRETLSGYAQAAAVIERERMARLARREGT